MRVISGYFKGYFLNVCYCCDDNDTFTYCTSTDISEVGKYNDFETKIYNIDAGIYEHKNSITLTKHFRFLDGVFVFEITIDGSNIEDFFGVYPCVFSDIYDSIVGEIVGEEKFKFICSKDDKKRIMNIKYITDDNDCGYLIGALSYGFGTYFQ